MGPAERAALRHAADTLAGDREAVARRAAAQARDRVPACGLVPAEDLMHSCLAHVDTAVRTLRSGTTADVLDRDLITALVRTREGQGMDVEAQIAGHRTVFSTIHETFIENSLRAGTDPRHIITGTGLLWRVGDELTRFVIGYRQERELHRRSRHDGQKREFLRVLLLEGAGVDEAVTRSGFRGFTPSVHYRAVRALPGAHSPHDLAHTIEASGSSERVSGVVTSWGNECIGLIPEPPQSVPGVAIALGPAVELDDLRRSFDTASDLVLAGSRLHADGVLTLESLGWRAAVGKHPDLESLLVRRYVRPFADAGRLGPELRHSLAEYLDADLALDVAAERLAVHPNTLRYRLRRISALLDVDLRRLDTLFEIRWALQCSPPDQLSERTTDGR